MTVTVLSPLIDLYSDQIIPEVKFTDKYWDENRHVVYYHPEIKLPWFIGSSGHVTPRRASER